MIEGIIRRLLVASGFFEAINFSFTRPDVFDKLRLHADHPLRRAVRLRNPLSEEHCILRTLLLPSLLEDLHWNENRNIRSLKIFEIARTFHPLDSEPTSHEKREMAAIAVGHRCQPYWSEEEGEVDFFLLKGMVEGLGQELGLTLEWGPGDLPFLHPRKAARIASNGRELGWIGQVHPEVAEAFGLGGLPYGFGLTDLDLIASLVQQGKRYSPLPKFPSVVRDLALMVPSDLLAQKAHELIRRAGGNLVGEVKLFDVYQGEKIPAGYKSLAFSVHYRAADRTLTDEEVNEVHSSLLQILQRDLGAKIR